MRFSISARIVGGMFLLLALMGVSIYLLADRGMTGIVNESLGRLHRERIGNVLGLLERSERRLSLTGMREAYAHQFEETVLTQLRAMEARSAAKARLVVISAEGEALLWPEDLGGYPGSREGLGIGGAASGGPLEIRFAVDGGREMWGVFQAFPPWGWNVGYLMPLEDKYADIYRFRRGFAAVLAGVTGVAALLALLLVTGIVKPITRLTRVAAAMARGDLNQTITDGRSDEVGVLVAAFARLQEAIRERIGELAVKNAALSSEIGERARAEEALQKALADLEEQNEQLKALDRLKDGLVRDVTHELKTPVAKFRMEIELLKETIEECGESAKVAELLETVDRSITRQEEVIRKILSLARLEDGKAAYRKERVDLAALAREVVDELRNLASGVGVELRADPQPAVVDGDGQMLRHALVNTVDNAVKFRRGDGPGRVTLRTSTVGNQARVIVEDDGIGMTAEEVSRAFQRFYQANPSDEGSGVGLSIVRRIVIDHDGTVTIASPGRGLGTTVTMSFPRPT